MVQEQVPVEDIARIFKYNLTNSCLLSSVLFSLALQSKDSDQRNAVLDDMRGIVNGGKKITDLEFRLEGHGEDYYAEKQEKLKSYMASGGYTIEMHHPSMDNLAGTIKNYPLIYLLYPKQEFFGMPTPGYIQHVISAVRLEGNELVLFEPYAGEIRKRSVSLIEEMWAGIGVVKKYGSSK
ncbi:MAG: hypothetical protein V1831_01235 [Candidatus Woesearchaeota archaeon]